MRKVIITKSYNLVAPEELAMHPQVRKYWQLPREYTLIEIVDPALSHKQPSCQTSRHAALASMAEGMLFAPFHRRLKSLADITTLHFSNAFNANSQSQPPNRELAQVKQGMSRSEGDAVIAADVGR